MESCTIYWLCGQATSLNPFIGSAGRLASPRLSSSTKFDESTSKYDFPAVSSIPGPMETLGQEGGGETKKERGKLGLFFLHVMCCCLDV
jgi:hypothetical protein